MNKGSQIHFFNYRLKFRVERKAELVRWLNEVIKSLEKEGGAINYILTSDKEMLKVNNLYLNRDNYTDVISFNLSEEESVISGDVFISIDRIRENAIRYKKEFSNEFNRVLVHGLLHLSGFTDDTIKEKRKMRSLENKFLKWMA